MEEVKIKCPTCGVILKVKNSQNEAVKTIKCPKCGATLKIEFRKEDSGRTMIGDMSDFESQVPTKTDHSQKVCKLKCGGKVYELREGMNSVGRRAPSSKATVQIPGDMKMSRNHAKIEVVRTASGKIKAMIKNWENANHTKVDGNCINDDDIFVLNNGSQIQMGTTNIIFIIE